MFDDYARFSGKTVSQNGGFSSLRSENFVPPLYLSHVKGLKFNARSKDNYIYQFNMKDEPGWNSVSWIAEFELKSGDDWQEVSIPFENFEAQWRGQKITKNKDGSAFRPMNLDEIHQVGITLSKFKYLSQQG